MPIIEFLNDYEGAMIAVFTFFLVCITAWYVYETMRMRRTTQQMLKVSNTPEIKVALSYWHPDINDLTVDLYIENIGTGFAYDIQFYGNFKEYEPEMSRKPLGEELIFKNGISHLGPGRRYQLRLIHNPKSHKLPQERKRTINVTYRDSANNTYDQTYPFDFANVEGYIQMGDPTLYSISESLRSIQRELSTIHKEFKDSKKP